MLPNELVLAERVTGFSSDGIDGAFLHLLLDGTEQGEKRLPGTFLQGDKGEDDGRLVAHKALGREPRSPPPFLSTSD